MSDTRPVASPGSPSGWIVRVGAERLGAGLMLLAYLAMWIGSKSSQLLAPEHRAPNWIREGVYWESVVNPGMRETYSDIYAQFLPPIYEYGSTLVVNAFGTDALNVFWMSLNTYGTAFLLLLCGGLLGSYAGGFVAAFLFLRSFDATQMTMGATAHGSSYLIVLGWMYLALRRKYVFLPLAPAVGLLLYQPVGFEVGVFTGGYLLLYWRGAWAEIRQTPRWVVAAVILACVVSLGVTGSEYLGNPIVDETTAETREQYVEYVNAGGLRSRLFLHAVTCLDVFDVRSLIDSRAILGPEVRERKLLLAAALMLALLLTRGRSTVLPGLVLIGSVSLYILADVLFPLLYQPSRMFRATLPMFTVLLVGTQLTMAIGMLLRDHKWRDLVAGVLAFTLTAALFGVGRHPFLKLMHTGSRACELARELPPDATLAIDDSYYLKYVHVCAARRTLYLSDVHNDPIISNLDEFKRRQAAYVALRRADSLSEVEQIGRSVGVTHVILGLDSQGDPLDRYPAKKIVIDEAAQAGRLTGCVTGEAFVIDIREPVGPVLAEPFNCNDTLNPALDLKAAE